MSEELFFLTVESPLGYINLVSEGKFLLSASFADHPSPSSGALPEILLITEEQLKRYFEGSLTAFNVPLSPRGTPFQKKVWEELRLVPYGETITYRDLAIRLGSPRYDRAVGHANGKNPIPVIIPCHRVTGKGGKLTGYAGGIWRKKWLLLHELRFSPYRNTLF